MFEGIGSIATTLLWVVFVAACALSAALGLILAYHWIRFSMNPAAPVVALIAYGGGCVLLLFGMFIAALAL